MKTERLVNIAVILLTLCALVTTGVVAHREFFPPHAMAPVTRVVPDWRSFARYGHRMGSPTSPVTIVVFSDFQCPFCNLLTQRLHALRAKYPTDVSVVYRHFPLAEHRYAVAAVRASECAADQGRFEAFYNAVFAAQDSIGVAPWQHFADVAKVRDSVAFNRCVASTSPIVALGRDTVAADLLHVRGTPTLLINQTELEGAPPLDTLEAYVARAIHSTQ